MSIKFLKVKIKSLTAESHIIRFEERRARGELRDALHWHRVREVRAEQRATLAAYGFLRGRALSAIEPNAARSPDRGKITAMVKKYGDGSLMTKLDAWFEAGKLKIAA